MGWLKRHGYHAITQRQLFDSLMCGRPLPRKPILITFDDGYRDALTNASPVLARLGMPATAYVISGRISNGDPTFSAGDSFVGSRPAASRSARTPSPTGRSRASPTARRSPS